MTDLSGARWVKSTRSASNGQCVEVAGPAPGVTADEWENFLRGAKQAGSTCDRVSVRGTWSSDRLAVPAAPPALPAGHRPTLRDAG